MRRRRLGWGSFFFLLHETDGQFSPIRLLPRHETDPFRCVYFFSYELQPKSHRIASERERRLPPPFLAYARAVRTGTRGGQKRDTSTLPRPEFCSKHVYSLSLSLSRSSFFSLFLPFFLWGLSGVIWRAGMVLVFFSPSLSFVAMKIGEARRGGGAVGGERG